MNALRLFFAWPDGGVWSNEVANLLWVPIAGFAGWFIQKNIKQHIDKRHDEVMNHVSKIHAHLGIEEK